MYLEVHMCNYSSANVSSTNDEIGTAHQNITEISRNSHMLRDNPVKILRESEERSTDYSAPCVISNDYYNTQKML